MIESHPIKNGFIKPDSKVIIMGTFPPTKEWQEKGDGFFFYSSEKNHFWNRIDNIFKFPVGFKKTKTLNFDETFFENKLRKEYFAEKYKIGFLDIYSKISRKKKSSADIDLISEETIFDNGLILSILNNNNVTRVCCTYSLALFELLKGFSSLIPKNIIIEENKLTADGKVYILEVNNRKIEIMLLYPATRSFHSGRLKDEQYQKLIFEHVI